MLSEQTVLSVVGRVYDTLQDPGAWPEVCKAIGYVFDEGWVALSRCRMVRGGPYITHSVDTEHPPVVGSGYDDPATNPFLRALPGIPVGGFRHRQWAISDAELRKTPIFNEFCRPMNLYPVVATNLGIDGQEASFIAIGHRQFNKELSSEEKKALELLIPHLQRVLQVERRLTECNNMRAATSEALDHLAIGVIFVDRNARVRFFNKATAAILDTIDGLTVTSQTLRAAHREQTKALRKLIDQAIQTTTGKGMGAGGAMALSRPSGARPFSVLVAPLPSEAAWGYSDSPAAVVFVSDPEREEELPQQLLMRLYGLTPTESAMASLLIQGQGLSHAAGKLQISINTAKTHQKRIFSKTGTSRQAELVRLVLKGPAGLY